MLIGSSRSFRVIKWILILTLTLAAVQYLLGSWLISASVQKYPYAYLIRGVISNAAESRIIEFANSLNDNSSNDSNKLLNETENENGTLLNSVNILLLLSSDLGEGNTILRVKWNNTINNISLINTENENETILKSDNITPSLSSSDLGNKKSTVKPKMGRDKDVFADIYNLKDMHINNHNQNIKSININPSSDLGGVKTTLRAKCKTEQDVFADIYNPADKDNHNQNILCDLNPPNLGPERVPTQIDLTEVEKKYPQVSIGGHFKPLNCTSRQKVAIIVPFRARRIVKQLILQSGCDIHISLTFVSRDLEENLALFLDYMHPFLMKQLIEYGIFIVEQEGLTVFNRAKLFNVGYVESKKRHGGSWSCFIFHDLFLLPLNSRNTYSCASQPRHMSVALDVNSFRFPAYQDILYGVTALTEEQFQKVNGFSNKYWGYGVENDDMAGRLRKNGYHIARPKATYARYTELDHRKLKVNPRGTKVKWSKVNDYKSDGLNSLQYQLINIREQHLYTHVIAELDTYVD